MFVCRACAKRWCGPSPLLAQAYRNGTNRARPTAGFLRPPLTSNHLVLLRSLTTTRAPRQEEAATVLTADEVTRQMLHETDRERRGLKNPTALDRKVRKALQYLRDPYTVGKYVEACLVKGKFEEALHLTRLASKNMQVVVSWNHLIDYVLKQEKLNVAVKLYNDMKKRGQLPNAQTYTVFFRGCTESHHPKTAVYQATRLYYALLDNKRIKPNTIHMNAVLQVCAKARDIESLFRVAKTTNRGLRAPNAQTYTTVFNGLRFTTANPHHNNHWRRHVKGDDGGVEADQEQVATNIQRSRAVWEEVVASWRQGFIVIDEDLVCAMGRILLMGGYVDNDDVLSLVAQTMGVPRQDHSESSEAESKLKSKESKSKKAKAKSKKAAETAETSTTEQAETTEATETEQAKETAETKQTTETAATETDKEPTETTETTATTPTPKDTNLFTLIPEATLPTGQFESSRGVFFARPGNNTLSMLLQSLSRTRKTTQALRYWQMLTRAPHRVEPDADNWYWLFKVLRRGHASAKATEMLQQMPTGFVDEQIFQMAMATCAADNLNENVFANAGKVLDLMSRTLRQPNLHVLRMYLQTAVANNRHYLHQQGDPQTGEGGRSAYGRQIVRALARLWDPLRLASNAVSYPGVPFQSAAQKRGETYNERREVTALARAMVSAADLVVSENLADEATVKDLRVSRNLLNRQITRFYEEREEVEPALRKDKDKDMVQKGGKKNNVAKFGRARRRPGRRLREQRENGLEVEGEREEEKDKKE